MDTKMKMWRLEKAPVLNDGTQGKWTISSFKGAIETWLDFDEAYEVAKERDFYETDSCYWRVKDEY